VRLQIAALATAGLVVSGCSLPTLGNKPPTTAQLINSAADNFAAATSLEVSGTFVNGSDTYAFDEELAVPNNAYVHLTLNSVQTEVVQKDGKLYFRGSQFVVDQLGTKSAYATQVAHAIGERWWTSNTAKPVFDLSRMAELGKINTNFFTTLGIKRKDNVNHNGVLTAELSGDGYVINITEAKPYEIVAIHIPPEKVLGSLSDAQLELSNYNKVFEIPTPSNVFDLDDHSTWPPMYYAFSISTARCNYPCILSGVFQNDGGATGAAAPSTATFTLTNLARGSSLGSCKVAIRPDIANGRRVTESCTISSTAWYNFSGTYTARAVVDNPAYH
jgi:hypothetical protein